MSTIYPIIGMSPGNSYFRDEVVQKLIEKVISKYSKTAIFIPDIPAISTYIALGYTENIARREKALPQGNSLRNKVQRAKTTLRYDDNQVRIISWQVEIENNPIYKEKYKEILNLYNTSKPFELAVDAATKGVLEYSNKEIPDLISATKIAVHYLLSEFAFMEFACTYLKASQVRYIYHKNWPVYESFIVGEFDGKKRDYLSFEIITT